MFSRILVPLDGSAHSERALPFAEALARPASGSLILVRAAHAHTLPGIGPTGAEAGAVRGAQEYLDALASELHQRALTVQTVVPYGEAAEWIVKEARQREVDLIVMATGCRTGLGGWLHRSVTKRVIARSSGPVLLVCGDDLLREMAPFDERPRLMVLLDGSPSSERALPVATQLSTELSGGLVLVRVVPSAEPIEWVYGHEAVELFGVQGEIEDLKTEAEEYLRVVAERLVEEGVDIRVEVCTGARAECVTDTSRRHGVSLVVLCTDTDDGSSSLVEQLRHTGMPLLLVTHPVHETCTSAEGT